ncbi:bifunctional phosphoribosyl-AMP cyclohydrolase/phosphoribosyl-ATP diphosphatase HisIE [Pseudothermotoga sp. U03pept]|uniref:bifunctional phosphoribosyl-AMP cyclohydrolase/phosphoribosyl-ATP diphosphatase HisIE n=1 Tax=Pseudothermotoga sp. U03pept TaxID=3447012 RepID=UPI003F108EE3
MELYPVVVQEWTTAEVLMLAYANQEALRLTKETGYAHFFSRERQKIWKKGESSGNEMKVLEIRKDCDEDAYLYIVDFPEEKVACHTGRRSCFFKTEYSCEGRSSTNLWLELYRLVKQRKEQMPEGSYTAKLLREGRQKIAKKLGEESTEVIIGYLQDNRENLIWEIADLLYHLTVLMVEAEITIQDVMKELERRKK